MLRCLTKWLLPGIIVSLALSGSHADDGAVKVNEWDLPYSADNPPGPTFTADEKQRQMVEGQRIQDEIIAACKAGRDSFTLPPGDYRFGANWLVTKDSFVLQGLHRTADKPFRILAHGATFWFNLSDAPAPSAHRMVKIIDCSHLTLEGLVIDSDPRGSMDARITAFDFDGNRIQVEPVKGARLNSAPPEAEGRFIPFKANGHHIAALYAIDAGWGPGNVFYQSVERTPDGHFWLTMKNEKLLRTIRDDTWRKTYGSAGTLEVGDVLGILYSTSESIWLSQCERITIRDCHVYAAKACISESEGYGDHQWINCRFMARPGSNNLLGGEGTMNNACQHGSTFDGVVVHRSTDDGFNNHGYWQHAESASGQTITFKNPLPQPLVAGDFAEVYDSRKKTFVGRFTLESVNGKAVTFREPLGNHSADATVIFPGHQNAGWVIRNSAFVDCYQRIVLQCGPGVFENNRVVRCGGALVVSNGPVGHIEGGSPDEVTIRNNLFLDTGNSPPNSTLSIGGTGRALKNIRIENNLVCNSGGPAIKVENVDGLTMRDNIFIHPFLGRAMMPETKVDTHTAIQTENIRQATLSGNVLLKPSSSAGAEAFLRKATTTQRASAMEVLTEFRRTPFADEATTDAPKPGL
jgi:hypothetical protein